MGIAVLTMKASVIEMFLGKYNNNRKSQIVFSRGKIKSLVLSHAQEHIFSEGEYVDLEPVTKIRILYPDAEHTHGRPPSDGRCAGWSRAQTESHMGA